MAYGTYSLFGPCQIGRSTKLHSSWIPRWAEVGSLVETLQAKSTAETLRCRQIVEMLTERCVVEEAVEHDRAFGRTVRKSRDDGRAGFKGLATKRHGPLAVWCLFSLA